MLDHQHRVAEVAQPLERGEQPRVVALMQADAGFVEDVQDSDEPRTDLCRQPNALRFAPGERLGAAVQREIIESDIHQKAQALAHFLDNRAGNIRVEPRFAGRAQHD